MNKKQQQNKQPAVPVAAGWAKQSRSLKMPSHLTTSLHYPVKCLTDNSPMVRFSAQYTRPSHGPTPPLHASRPAADRFLVSRHVGKVLQTCNGHRQHMAPVSNGRPCARLGRCSGEGEGVRTASGRHGRVSWRMKTETVAHHCRAVTQRRVVLRAQPVA